MVQFPPKIDPSKILKGISKGDHNSFEKLYELYEKPIFGFIKKLTGGDQPLSEDIFQRGWLKLIEGAEKYQEQGKFESWIYTIFRRVAYTEFNKRKKSLTDSDLVNDKLEKEQSEAEFQNLQDFWESQEELNMILDHVNRLPDMQRMILVSYLTEDLDYEKLAKEYEISVSSVKSYLFRARQTLKEVFDER